MKKRPTIGLMLGNINKNFTDEIVKGAIKYADEFDLNIVLISSSRFIDDEEGFYMNSVYCDNAQDYFKHIGIDVLVISYASIYDMQENDIKKKFLSRFKDIPYVLLQDNFYIEGKSNLFVNNKKGLSKCIEHLILEHNYKNILYFSGPKHNYDSKERLKSYKETMEKHKLPVTPNMIAYGNFSKEIDTPLNKLLDNNKNIDAIVFANDTMALASYPILEKRGYTIGKDIAITGFDNLLSSSITYPALTTVSQNPMKLGYEAIKEAINLYNGNNQSVVLDTEFVLRNSCGCQKEKTSKIIEENSKENIINSIISKVIQKNSIAIDIDYTYIKLKNITNYIENNIEKETILSYIKDITKEYIKEDYSYNRPIYELLTELLISLKKEYNDNTTIDYLLNEFQKWIFYYSIDIKNNYEQSTKETILENSFILKKLMTKKVLLNEMIESIFKQFKHVGVKSCYISLFKDNYNKEKNNFVETIYLKGYYNDKETIIYSSRDNVRNNGRKYLGNDILYAYNLGSTMSEYGYVVVEVNYELIESVKLICEHLNTLLYFNELNNNNLKSQKLIEKSYQEIEKKNAILNNISKFDELTQVYNRRGFIENSIEYVKNNNIEMEMIFCDLDHLKEINDNFGHKEGDFAIKKISETLQKTLPKNTIIGRIGGDEFVALFPQKKATEKKYYEKIKNELSKYNKKSKKNYYIETSIGYAMFNCNEQTDILSIINKADSYLYEDKKKRRASIIK